MVIPATTDPVLGEDDPGGTPIAIGSMGSASGLAFAYLSNNLQYLRDVMIFDDVTINVSNITELAAALDVLDRVIYVHKDKTFAINLAPGSYVWPAPGSEPRSALHAYGISGAGSVLFTVAGVTIEGECTSVRPLIEFMDCTCNLVVSGAVILNNDTNGSARAVTFDNVRQVTALDLTIRNKVLGNTLSSGVYCREADFVDLGLTINNTVGLDTGVGRAVYARQNSRIYFDSGNLTVGKLTNEVFHLEKSSQVLFENFDSCLPLGADTGLTHDDPASVDPSSRIAIQLGSSSGSGTSSSPYVITVAWESGTDTAKLVQYIFGLLPRPLDVWIKLKLPAGTMTDPIEIKDIEGRGGLLIEGNTVKSDFATDQDSIIDDDDGALIIKRVKVPVLVSSIRCDNDQGPAAIEINGSDNVQIYFCYLIAATGTGGSPVFGNGLFALGPDTNVYLYKNYFGACNQYGINAYNGAQIAAPYNTEVDSGSNRPQQEGNNADFASVIRRSVNSGQFVTGAGGIDRKDLGGQVWFS